MATLILPFSAVLLSGVVPYVNAGPHTDIVVALERFFSVVGRSCLSVPMAITGKESYINMSETISHILSAYQLVFVLGVSLLQRYVHEHHCKYGSFANGMICRHGCEFHG